MTHYLQAGHGLPCPVLSLWKQVLEKAKGTDKVIIIGRVRHKELAKHLVAIKNLHTQSDAALVKRMGAEPEALACLYDRYASLVYAIALRVAKDPMAAEEIVSDVFLQLWRNPSGFDEIKGRLPSWLTVITRNRAVDFLRRRKPGSEVSVEDAPPPQTASQQYFAADFEKAQRIMNGLPQEQKKALELAYLDGLTQAEISAKLSEPLGTVKSRIRLGLSALRKALA